MCLEKKFPSNNSLIIICNNIHVRIFAVCLCAARCCWANKKKNWFSIIFKNILVTFCTCLFLVQSNILVCERVEFVTLRSYLPNIIIIISEYMRCHFQNIYYDYYYLYILVWHWLNTSQSSLWSAKLNFIFL